MSAKNDTSEQYIEYINIIKSTCWSRYLPLIAIKHLMLVIAKSKYSCHKCIMKGFRAVPQSSVIVNLAR